MKLTGKVGIITGATSGMGKAMAQLFSEEGASLVLSGRSEARGAELVSQLTETRKGNSFFVPGDVGRPEQNEKLVNTTLSSFGKLDFVITNAGVLGIGSVTDVDPATWHQTFDINFHAVFYLARYSLPHLVKNQGTFIGNASIAAFKNFPNHPAYCASKAAMVSLIKQIAMDYGPEIRANCLCPGPVDTPLIWDSAKAFENPGEAVQQAGERTLLKRLGTPEDVAQLALFLASGESSWITGTTINIDGGIMSA